MPKYKNYAYTFKIMHDCEIFGCFSQYFLKNKYHHCEWWQTKYSNLYLRLFTTAFIYSFHIYYTYCLFNLLALFKLTSKSFKMIVVWVLVCFSFNKAKWAQVHMDLFFLQRRTCFISMFSFLHTHPPPSAILFPPYNGVQRHRISQIRKVLLCNSVALSPACCRYCTIFE